MSMRNIGQKALLEIPIRKPPFEEQTEIVHRVDRLFAHSDRIEQQANNALARVNNLTQSILAKAFRGELTEQWRKDNPELIIGDEHCSDVANSTGRNVKNTVCYIQASSSGGNICP